MSTNWVNFHDPESGLLDMEWRVGTSPGHGDILPPTRLHVTDEVTANLTQPLPLGRRVYVTLKVINKAGTQTFLITIITYIYIYIYISRIYIYIYIYIYILCIVEVA